MPKKRSVCPVKAFFDAAPPHSIKTRSVFITLPPLISPSLNLLAAGGPGPAGKIAQRRNMFYNGFMGKSGLLGRFSREPFLKPAQ
jgi:hypothetical protein